MPLDRFPGATRRDAHLLVVVANRAARSKGIAKPETVVGRNTVGNIRKAGCALVCCHHQINVVGVMANHFGRRHDEALDQVVSEVQQAAKKELVAGYTLGQRGFAVSGGRWILQHEAAFGTDRNNHRVLDMLGFHQTQNLGAEIFAPVRPAQAAACHLAVAQMNALNARRIDPDFKQRFGLGQTWHLARVELEAQVWLVCAVSGPLPEVGTQGCQHAGKKLAQDAVLIQTCHLGQMRLNLLLQQVLRGFPVAGRGGVKAGMEQFHNRLRDQGVAVQSNFDVVLTEGKTKLPEVARIGAQHGDGTGIQRAAERQFVQVIALDFTAPGQAKEIFKTLLDTGQIGLDRQLQTEIVNPEQRIGAANVVGVFIEHQGAHALQHRQGVRQRDFAGTVDLETQLTRTGIKCSVKLDSQRRCWRQAGQHIGVLGRDGSGKIFAVSSRKGIGKAPRQQQPLTFAMSAQQLVAAVVLPALRQFCDARFQRRQVDILGRSGPGPHQVMDARLRAVGQGRGELDRLPLQRTHQFVTNPDA